MTQIVKSSVFGCEYEYDIDYADDTPEAERFVLDAMKAFEQAFVTFHSNLIGQAEYEFRPTYIHVSSDGSTYNRHDNIWQWFANFERWFQAFRSSVLDQSRGYIEPYPEPDYEERHPYPNGNKNTAAVILSDMVERFDAIYSRYPADQIDTTIGRFEGGTVTTKGEAMKAVAFMVRDWSRVKDAVAKCLLLA